jgi:ankyrin repeat protein
MGLAESGQEKGRLSWSREVVVVKIGDVEEWRRALATALFVAARDGHLAQVKRQLAAGADPNASIDRNARGKGSALGAAVAAGSVECAEAILAAGGDIEALWCPQAIGSSLLLTPLTWAARDGNARMAALLINHGASVDAIDSGGAAPLHHAAARGRAAVVGLLIKAGATVGILDGSGVSPLMAAAFGGYPGCIRRLCAAAPEEVNRATKDGRSSLMVAIEGEAPLAEAIQALLEGGADPSQEDERRRQPLAVAMKVAFWGDGEAEPDQKVQAARLLLAAGADANARDIDGDTALSTLARKGGPLSEECANILMGFGADPSLGPGGKSAASVARAHGHADLASFIEAMATAMREEGELAEQLGGGVRRARERAGL